MIRVLKKIEITENTFLRLKDIFDTIGWDMVSNFVFSRLNRIKRIQSCDVIYIGGAGGREGGGGHLKGRYDDLANRHTIQFPLWLLLFLGWQFKYGWLQTEQQKPKKRIKDYLQRKS